MGKDTPALIPDEESSRAGEAEFELELVQGEVDDEGRPHGFCIVRYEEDVLFRGSFTHGVKTGRGTFEYGDNSAFLTGEFRDDVLQGAGVYIDKEEETIMFGEYDFSGELNGRARIFRYEEPAATAEGEDAADAIDGGAHVDANQLNSELLVAEGYYKKGQRQGVWTFFFDAGCYLEGKVDSATGLITDDKARFYFPDGSYLIGEWVNGEMRNAHYVPLDAITSVAGKRSPDHAASSYKYDEASDTSISSDPLLPDPYEQIMVYCKKSIMPDAGEGLFAKRRTKPGTLLAFYNGIRLSHDLVNGRSWEENSNTISLDDDVVIDVPKPYDSTEFYQATLGHKCNHSFQPNCRYSWCFHPRFGHIRSIESIRYIEEDEECTVHYDYNEITSEGDIESPGWYRNLLSQQTDGVAIAEMKRLGLKKRLLEKDDFSNKDKFDASPTKKVKIS